jgi:lauroyl/myristoyl acyltransferase
MNAADQVAEPRSIAGMSAAEFRDLALYRLMSSLPVSLASRLGATLGQFLGRRAHPAADARVVAAIRQLRPDLAEDPATLARTQIRFWANVGRIYAEYCLLPRLLASGRVTVVDQATFDAVLADGRPVIVPFVHLGNWETSGHLLSLRAPGRVCALANALPANRVQAQIASMQRARMPAKVLIFDGTSWRHVLQHLESPGGIIYVAIDEVMEGRVSTPSFGRRLDPHANIHKIVRIAARVGGIIMPIFSERLDGARFRTHVLPPLEFTRQGKISQEEQLVHVHRLDAMYQAEVLRRIDQWFGLLDFR